MKGAVKDAQKDKEIGREVDAERTAFELNAVLLGAYWAHLMGQSRALDKARDTVLDKLEGMATEEVPSKAFKSVGAFRRYLKEKHP